MSQKKKLIFIVSVLVLIGAIVILIFLEKETGQSEKAPQLGGDSQSAAPAVEQKTTGPITPPSEEALVNNANPNTYSFAGDPKAEKIEVEFMSDTEKTSMGIPTAARIQVLDRDASGKCTAWKIINQDSEILHEYVK